MKCFSKVLFYEKLFHFWKWSWTLSQTWYLSCCEQILELGTSCPAVFVIQPVFLSGWRSVSNLRNTCVVILYSFKLNAFNSSLGTNELPWYERRNKWYTCCLNFEWEYNSNTRWSNSVKPQSAEVDWRRAVVQLHLSLRTPDFQKCCTKHWGRPGTTWANGSGCSLPLATQCCGSTIGM